MIKESDILPGYKWIVVAKGYLGGNPSIYNKRTSVDLILKFLSQGMTPDEIATDYELPKEAILEAIDFARSEVAKRKVGT